MSARVSKIQFKIIPCREISKLSNSNHHTSHPVTLCSLKTDWFHLLRNEYIYSKYFIKSPVNVLHFSYWRYCVFDFSGKQTFRERESLYRRKIQTDEYAKCCLQILLWLNLLSGQTTEQDLVFSRLCYVPLCHWAVEHRERPRCICLHKICWLCVLS